MLALGVLLAVLSTKPEWTGTHLPLRSVSTATADLTFARYPDPVLRMDAGRVEAFDADLATTARLLRNVRRREGAVGLAATQCGINASIVVLGDDVFVNPVLRPTDTALDVWRETCLVLPPDVEVETLRWRSVDVHAFDLSGRPFQRSFSGEQARAFQHELDHAHGILILDHSSEVVHSRAFPPLARLEGKFHNDRRRRAWRTTSLSLEYSRVERRNN